MRASGAALQGGATNEQKETVILSDESLDHEAVKRVITGAGYTPLSVTEKAVEKKGLFHWGKG